MGTRIKELEQIVGGTDKRIAQKLSQYEKSGKEKTVEGRKLASDLVLLYSENYYTQDEAYKYAQLILKEEIEESEYSYMAKVAEFAGDYARGKNNNKVASDYYLSSASYYRSVQNTAKAASTLYQAAEALVASGLKGDAKDVADLLKELYPDTNYAALVDKIVR